jgi:hypothetical protein
VPLFGATDTSKMSTPKYWLLMLLRISTPSTNTVPLQSFGKIMRDALSWNASRLGHPTVGLPFWSVPIVGVKIHSNVVPVLVTTFLRLPPTAPGQMKSTQSWEMSNLPPMMRWCRPPTGPIP